MEQETKPYRREDYTLGNGLYLSERQVGTRIFKQADCTRIRCCRTDC